MWCGDEAVLKEGLIDDGLTLPAVDDEVGDLAKLQPLQQGGTRGDGATTSIDEERTTRTALEEGLIDHPLGSVLPRARQWYVKCDDIALTLDRLERDEALCALTLSTRWVTEQRTKAEGADALSQASPDIPYPDDTDSLPLQRDASLQRPAHERREDILHDAPGIAPWCTLPADTRGSAVVGIDMIKARGSRGDDLDTASLEELAAGVHHTANEQGTGATNRLGREVTVGQAAHVSDLLHQPLQIW